MTIYGVPDTPETEDTICMQIEIPDKHEYRVAFWTAMYHFTKWVAWERDGSDRAKRAAAVWKPLIMQAREDYENGVGCDGECDMEIRQNPANPCQLQVREGAGEWETIADFSECKPSDNNALGNPALYITEPSGGLYPDQLNIQRLAQQLQYLIYSAYPSYGQTENTAIGTMKSYMNFEALYYVDPALRAVYRAVHENFSSAAEVYAAFTALDWDGLRDSMYCTQSVPVEESGSWLQDLSDNLMQFFQDTSDTLFQSFEAFVSFLTGDPVRLNHFMWTQPTGGATFGDISCEWEETFDFTVSDGGWALGQVYDEEAGQGEWVSGVGWRSTWGISGLGNVGDERVIIEINFPNTKITYAQMHFIVETPYDVQAGHNFRISGVTTPDTTIGSSEADYGYDFDNFTSFVAMRLAGGLWDDYGPPQTPSGRKCYITEAVIRGIGENPFT